MKIKLTLSIFSILLSIGLSAQQDTITTIDTTKSNINIPVDTITPMDTTIIDIEEAGIDSAQIKAWDSLAVFQECWDNVNLFPYRHPVAPKVPDSLMIVLVDSNRKFVMPVIGKLNSPYGWRGRRMHNGIDIKLAKHDTVLACMDGKVRYAGYNRGGYGYLIIIRHFNGLESYYSHLTKIKVERNEYVTAGQFIGTGGNSGAPRVGPHLHWELRWKDYPFDPQHVVDYDNHKLKTDTLIITPKVIKYKPTSKSGKVHIVKSGDTLSAIAARHKTSVGYLCKLNGIRSTSILQIGQRILLP
jgi:LysM repeat protein